MVTCSPSHDCTFVWCLFSFILGGDSYGSSSEPRTFGSGGGRGCYYYSSCSSSDKIGVGGSGGGRVYM